MWIGGKSRFRSSDSTIIAPITGERHEHKNIHHHPRIILSLPPHIIFEIYLNAGMRRSRKEWIDAVYGPNFFSTPSYIPPSRGSGLAGIGEFICYSVELKRNHNDSKLGLSLSNIRLGLCVINVKRHSEAEYAGVIPGSVLVSINGVGLLCEMSVSAIGVVWMLEHCPISRGSLRIVEMELIFKGKKYTVHMFSNNFGIEWQSVDDFTVIQNAPKEGDIKKGSLMLSFNDLTFRSTNTAQFASSISEILWKNNINDCTFSYTPKTARLLRPKEIKILLPN